MTRKERYRLQQKSFRRLMYEADCMRRESYLTDIVLLCEGREYPVHKIILSAVSLFFREQFKKVKDSKRQTIKIDFVNHTVLEAIVQFCYTGSVVIDDTNKMYVKEITETSIKLGIPLMSRYCLRYFLGDSMSVHAITKWRQIEDLNSEGIKDIFFEYLLRNLKSLKVQEHFLALEASQLNSLLQCRKINTCDADEVLESILCWVKHNEKLRKRYLNRYLEKVDLNKISSSLLAKLQHEPLLANNITFLNVYKKGFFHFVTTKQMRQPQKEDIAVKDKSSLQYGGSIDKQKGTMSMPTMKAKDLDFIYEPRKDKPCSTEMKKSALNENKTKTSKPVANTRKLFVYGVDNYDNPKLYCKDYHNQISFTNLLEMENHPLKNIKFATICNYKRRLYAFGGFCIKTKSYLNSCYAYDIQTNHWQKKKDMREPRCFANAVQLNGSIYVIGGEIGNSSNSAWCYNPTDDSWKCIAKLPVKDNSYLKIPITAMDKYLFAAVNGELFRYDPAFDFWRRLHLSLPEQINIIAVDNILYIIEGAVKIPKHIWMYDMANDSLQKGTIGVELNFCKALYNLKKPKTTEILVIGEKKSFLYRPPSSWEQTDPININSMQIISY